MLEPFDRSRHDPDRVASLLWQSDPEFNALVYGQVDIGTKVMRALLDRKAAYYTAPYLRCAVLDGAVVGVVSAYPVKERRRLERSAGAAFAAVFGMCGFLRRLPTLLRLGAILQGALPRDATYVVYLCVADEARGKGIGRAILGELAAESTTLALHVSGANLPAIAFYEALGFVAKVRRAGKAGGARHAAIMMVRPAADSHPPRSRTHKL